MGHPVRRPLVFAVVALVIGSRLAAAQSGQPAPPPADIGELVTDRPDFTESSQVVPRGWYQLESGLSYEGEGREARSFAAPAALVRIGLGHRIELRLAAEGLLTERVAGVRASGHSDVEVGGKAQLLSQDRAAIDLALIPAVSVPTGADGFSSDSLDPSLKVTWGRDLPGDVGMTGNFNVASTTDAAGRFTQGAVTLSFGRALSANWSAYAEAYAFTRLERGGDAAVTVNGGLTRALGQHMQFDIEAGRGVTAAAPDWFVGAGFALRHPFGR